MIGLIASQGVFEHLHRQLSAPPMSANLCHQEHLVAASAPERPSQDGLGFAVIIFPGVVEEINAGICRLVDQSDRLVQSRNIAEVMSADTDRRDLRASASDFAIDHLS